VEQQAINDLSAIEGSLDYAAWVDDSAVFRQYVDQQIAAYPELFSDGIELGYRLHGLVESSRRQIKTRRILLPTTEEAYRSIASGLCHALHERNR
jgi:hypothetical protein